MPHAATRLIFFTALSAALAFCDRAARGQTAWYEGFEGPQPSWRQAGGNLLFRVEQHQRLHGDAHTGEGCEFLRVSGAGGSEILFRHDAGQPRVIDELMPTLWIKADRPGLQLVARAVLPRTADPRTGRAVSVLIHGSSYTSPGRWQQLRIDDFPQQLARQTWVLRTQLGSGVDPREAYVEELLLNVYGGPGSTSVWIDDLDIAGYVGPPAKQPEPLQRAISRVEAATPSPPYGRPASDAVKAQTPARIKMGGSVLLVDERPIFPRAIEYRGEPLKQLRALGFNAAWLSEPPTVQMLEEARQVGLWLICPPPQPLAPVTSETLPAPLPKIGPLYDGVLAWNLGRGLADDQLETTQRWAEQVRAADSQSGRPLVCQPAGELRAYSRPADVLLIGRSPLGSSLELADYGTWIRERPRVARPGTTIWTTIQTQPCAALRRQWGGLRCDGPPPSTFAAEQIRLLAYTSMTAGSRGFLFESESSLDSADRDAQIRAMTLEQLNLELDLIEPFLAGGTFVSAVPGSEPGVIGAVLQTDRARVLVPVWSAPGAQFVSGQSASGAVTFVVPGVPESNEAYQVLPGGLRRLGRKRVTGGTRVTIDEFGLTSLVLLTQDPLVFNNLSQRAAAIGQRAAVLARELAAAKLRLVEQVDAQLLPRNNNAAGEDRWLPAARETLQSCDGALAAKDYRASYLHAEQAMRPLRLLERERWQAAIAGFSRPLASPASVCFATLPCHARLVQQISNSRLGENRLIGGDFEDLGTLHQSGWRHFQHHTAGIYTEADFPSGSAHSGQYGLRLAARPSDPERAAVLAESPPMWITSPEILVSEGELVCIEGWVQIPSPITGSVDGLLIVDSFTGEALAERIGETTGWQQFTLYRVAPESGRLTVTFALSGMGEAWLDDVRICPVQSISPVR
ncbi:MAG: hypothetical protein HUU20_16230 [Pirellulales bacterium]|nr:hypothetical protein [Pirellulales bacterium]